VISVSDDGEQHMKKQIFNSKGTESSNYDFALRVFHYGHVLH